VPPPVIPAQVALEVVDLQTGVALLAQQPEILDRPVHPGSVAKVFTLRAALDAGEVDARSRVDCRAREAVGGRVLECAHPRFGRPLSASDALAHSCNSFFVAVAKRLTWLPIADALRRAGLPAAPAPREPALGAVGLEGPQPSPRALLVAFAKVVALARQPDRPQDRLLLDGLRDAALTGTASALGEQGLDALAKTGSGRIVGGAPGGLVVALAPADAPRYGVVVLGAGIAGRDAAAFAGAALQRAVPSLARARHDGDDVTVSVGIAETAGHRVIRLGLEDYVAGVVDAEAPPGAHRALGEVLAIAARSFVLASRGRHSSEGFDVCDLTHCQAYRAPGDASRAAAQATQGLVVTGAGEVLPAFHSAECGGALESPDATWPDPRGLSRHMTARPDPAGTDEGTTWTSDVVAADLRRALRAAGVQGPELLDLSVTARTSSGRVARLSLRGLVPDSLAGESFRLAVVRTLGWQVLKSSLYSVKRTARGYRFTGRGRGHGVGLCVLGAGRMATRGQSATQILAAYFPGTEVRPMPVSTTRSRVRIVLPSLDEAEQPSIAALANSSYSSLEKALNVRGGEVVIRFHPTARSYVRASGRPWWTGGATAGTRIELMPLADLRERGLLERTLRHELVHVLTADALAGRPRWVAEGLAMRLADPGAPAPRMLEVECPSDAEFTRARSAGALAPVYERAATCVARELERVGGDWRTLGRSR
jgi:SpoIID/LytB domain protein